MSYFERFLKHRNRVGVSTRCPDCNEVFVRSDMYNTADPEPHSSISVIRICPNNHVWTWSRKRGR